MFRGLFFIIFIINIHNSSCAFRGLYEAGQQVWRLYSIIDNEELCILNDTETSQHSSNDPIIRDLEKQMDGIHESLEELRKFMSPKKIVDIIRSWQMNASITRDIDIIELFAQSIDEQYDTFEQYRNATRNSDVSSNVQMDEIFAFLPGEIAIVQRHSQKGKLQINEEDPVAAIAGFARARGAEICGNSRIISHLFMQLFRMLIMTELQSSTMLAYKNIHGYLMNEDKQESKMRNLMARDNFEQQFTTYLNIFSSNIAVIDVVYNSACDPPNGNWIRDDSFYELEKSVRPILFSYNSHKCKTDSCYNMMFEDISRCEIMFYGDPPAPNPDFAIGDCTLLGHIETCVLNSSLNRFHYVKSEVLGFLGNNTSCPEDNGRIIETNPTPPGRYAACECNFWSSPNRISLLPIESDVRANRVITGLKFVRKNKVLHIQLREGELKPHGYINDSSQIWIDIFENETSPMSVPINKANRVFFLEDLVLPTGYVLTGIQLKKVTRGFVTGFALEIFGSPFDYETGKVSFKSRLQRSWEKSNEKSEKRPSSPIAKPIVSTLPYIATLSDTKYISFGRSALKENFGQSTLPLFDAVPITFESPSALGGVGISHKGIMGAMGLISLRVYGIQYEEYFNDFKLSHMINDKVSFNSFYSLEKGKREK